MAEAAENTCRKALMPEESVDVGEQMRPLAEAEARGRQGTSGKLPEVKTGQTRDIVAKQVGMKGSTYERAKEIVEAARAEPKK